MVSKSKCDTFKDGDYKKEFLRKKKKRSSRKDKGGKEKRKSTREKERVRETRVRELDPRSSWSWDDEDDRHMLRGEFICFLSNTKSQRKKADKKGRENLHDPANRGRADHDGVRETGTWQDI
ncbi:hypothetical protein CISG_07765 [Coccidioides immitis RMSCC 3703]|uniref:Uncharacterized protein n=1 Tax=Coccidioides immitis RMSCC 3703 TaxID=454286 RepID=A0A0J8R3P9_COCIT|nr:hypothetical protein CISG_07765 [Coccidioides immitis RMSCC 3703]